MCRMLYIKSSKSVDIRRKLEKFARICLDSPEYQGHGWGMVYMENGQRKLYKTLKPIWEDNFDKFPDGNFLLVHARSAFRDKDIVIENNMPFLDGARCFTFNGELNGVRINMPGRTGAEKIFNCIKRFYTGDMDSAFKKAIAIIIKRSTYIKALNMMLTDSNTLYLASFFNEQEEYFTMYKNAQPGILQICSQPFSNETNWVKIENNSIEVYT